MDGKKPAKDSISGLTLQSLPEPPVAQVKFCKVGFRWDFIFFIFALSCISCIHIIVNMYVYIYIYTLRYIYIYIYIYICKCICMCVYLDVAFPWLCFSDYHPTLSLGVL